MAIFNKFLGFRGRNLSTAITFCSGLIFISFGYGQADVGGLVTVQSFLNQFPKIDLLGHLPHVPHQIAVDQGITIASWNLGCFASALLTVFIGDKLGRRRTLLMGITLLIIGKIIQASSYHLGQYIAGRVIAGLGNGFNASTAPAWQAECTKAHRRGRMLMVSSGACIALGVAIAFWFDFALAFAGMNSVSWRFPVAAQIIWVLPCLFLLNHLPESPRWLILVGREQEALDVLAALNDLDPSHEDIRSEFMQIKDAILQMASGDPKQAFSMGDYRYLHRIILAVLLQIMQQWTGVNLFIQYLAAMFSLEANIMGWPARLLAACASTEFMLVTLFTAFSLDRYWGRRTLTMVSSAGMCVCMIILAVLNSINHRGEQTALAVMLFIYISFFALGWQGMSWLWAVELIPLPVRGPGNALATSANWISNFIIVLCGPVLFINITYKTYIIFAVTNFVIVPTIYFLYPETGYRSLEECDVLFHLASQTKHPWLAVRDVAAAEPLWYGKNGRKPFAYEQSEWHMRFARLSSDEDGATSSGRSEGRPSAARDGAMMEKEAGMV